VLQSGTFVAATDADVDRDRLLAADALELALLQRAQQLDLHRQRHVVDVVEEERAAVASSKRPRRSLRVGERALLVTEQLALEQRLGQRAARQRDERLLARRRAGGSRARCTPCRCRSPPGSRRGVGRGDRCARILTTSCIAPSCRRRREAAAATAALAQPAVLVEQRAEALEPRRRSRIALVEERLLM
jgi:hypothetical protein